MILLPLRPSYVCPDATIIVVDGDSRVEDADRWSWRFGPNTRNPWPDGDYYHDGAYHEPACQTYAAFYNEGAKDYREYRAYPEYLTVDIGL